jgi:pyrrolysine biosynthesis protein PylD
MTRLTAHHVSDPGQRLQRLDRGLLEVSGLDLRLLALKAAGQASGDDAFAGARVAAVPVTSGQGPITGFCQAVAAVARHLGCDAWVTEAADVRGIHEATQSGAEVLFLADDARFVALNVRRGRCIDNDPATAGGYVAALEAAAGTLQGRPVLLLGLGPVGLAAARGLLGSGADVNVVEPDAMRLRAALISLPELRPVFLAEGLGRCDLILDACPAPGIIDGGHIGPSTIAAVPGIPSGFTAEAQAALGTRHIHDPLAIGVAVMAALALV